MNNENPKKPNMAPSPKGGFILTAGAPGNRGGHGRPPNIIRSTCREGFAAAIEHARLIAQGKTPPGMSAKPTYADMMRAMQVLSRYGMEKPEVIVPAQLELALANLLKKYVPAEERYACLEEAFESLLDCPAPESPTPPRAQP